MFENVNHIIFIASRDCNLRCTYCFEDNKDSYKGDRMSFETLKELVSRIRHDKARSLKKSSSSFEFSFHGGEPMLLGPENTENFIKYVKENLLELKISFSMQSNISLLSKNWYPLLKKQLQLGVSFDGLLKRNNLNRTKSNILNKNLKRLRRNKINFGFVMVLQKNNIRDFIYNAKKLFKKYGSIKANLVENIYDERNTYPEVTSEDYFQYVFLPTYQHFLKTGKTLEYNMRRTIQSFCEGLIFNPPLRTGICNLKFCGGGTHMVQVEPNGKVSFCQRWSDTNTEKVIGNILSPEQDPWGLPSLLKSLKLQLRKAKDIRALNCDTCIAQDICNYGCMSFALTKYNGRKTIRPELICDFYKKVALFLYKERMTVLFVWAQKQNLKPAHSYSRNVLLFEIPSEQSTKESAFVEQINKNKYLKIDRRQVNCLVKLRYMLKLLQPLRKKTKK